MDKSRLQNAAKQKTEKLFSGSSQKLKKANNVKKSKKVFSFRAYTDDIDKWRIYLSISGGKADETWSKAMNEYINNHPLAGTSKQLFNEKINS